MTLRERVRGMANASSDDGEEPLYQPEALALAVMELCLEAAAKECETPELECCGNPVVGAEYMGQQEMICCGQPERDEKSALQCAAAIRALADKGRE